MITAREIKWLFIALLFSVFYWFIMEGMVEWFKSNFPSISTVLVGFMGIMVLFYLYKYKGVLG